MQSRVDSLRAGGQYPRKAQDTGGSHVIENAFNRRLRRLSEAMLGFVEDRRAELVDVGGFDPRGVPAVQERLDHPGAGEHFDTLKPHIVRPLASGKLDSAARFIPAR